MTSEDVILKIGGKAYSGWTSVRISTSIETLCAGFSLELVDRAPGQASRYDISNQAPCEIWLGSDLLITGYIYDYDEQWGAREHRISVSGRDRTGDLVDCAADTRAFKGQKLEAIVAALLKPFGLSVQVDIATGAAFAAFQSEPGEKVIEAITRMCRMRGLMLRTDRNARLIIYRPAESRAIHQLELGRNLTGLSLRSSSADRFSTYKVLGQHQGGEFISASDAARPKGEARDEGMLRHRPLVLVADEQSTGAGVKARAQWEATTRLGRAETLRASLAGWRNDDGRLFNVGDTARVVVAPSGIDRNMLITSVELQLAEASTTSLGLSLPEAYTSEPLDPKRGKKGKSSGADWAITPGFG